MSNGQKTQSGDDNDGRKTPPPPPPPYTEYVKKSYDQPTPSCQDEN